MAESGKPDRAGRMGVVLRDALPWSEMLEVVETAEDTGFEAVFVPEIAAREAFATLAGFARATSRIRLGTGVVTSRSRSPVTTAMAAATVQELSGGRHVLGLGTGTSAGDGGDPTPLATLRAYVDVVRRAWSGQVVDDDRFGTMGFQMTWTVDPPPIWLAALGDRAVATAGEVADGVLLNWCTPERVRSARATIERSAERAGRDPSAVTVAVYVRACLGVEEAAAMPALAAAAALYVQLPPYRAQFEAMGFAEEARTAVGGGPVPEGLVRALTVMGDRAEAMARFGEYRAAGADVVLCYPIPALEPQSSILGTILAAAPSPAVER